MMGKNFFLSDNNMKKIVGKGKLKLCFNDERVKILDDVLHILRLTRNLLSISKLNDFGMHVKFDKSGCRLVRGILAIAKGSQNGLCSGSVPPLFVTLSM